MLGKDDVNRKELTAAVGELNRVGVIDKPINPVGKKTDILIREFVETIDNIPDNIPLPKKVVKMYNYLISDEVDEELPDDEDILEVDLNDIEEEDDDESENEEEEEQEEGTDVDDEEEGVEEEEEENEEVDDDFEEFKPKKKEPKKKSVIDPEEDKTRTGLLTVEYDPVMEYVNKTGNTKTPMGHRVNSMGGMIDILILEGKYTKQDIVEKLCLSYGKPKKKALGRVNIHLSQLKRDGYMVKRDLKLGGILRFSQAVRESLNLDN